METDSVLHQQLPTGYRTLQPQAAQAIQHGQQHLGHHALASQAGLDLTGLEDPDSVFHQDLRLQDPNAHAFQSPITYDRNHGHRPMHVQNNGSPHTPQQQHNGGQFGILTAGPMQHSSIGRLQEEDIFATPEGSDQKSNGHLSTKIVPNPPNLAEWRQKLFNVDEMITLSEEEYVVLDRSQTFADFICTDFRRTFHMWIMSTPIVRPSGISGSHSSLTTGIVVLRADHQEHLNRMTQTRRSEREQLERGIFAMSRSRSQNTSRVLCCEQISYQMEVNHKIHRATTSLLLVNQETKEYTNTSLECHWLTIL
jgi:hypothetical protein